MLFNEPKLLKLTILLYSERNPLNFSALQRAEIAEISNEYTDRKTGRDFSALQRAEIAETSLTRRIGYDLFYFSALQRAEIAET